MMAERKIARGRWQMGWWRIAAWVWEVESGEDGNMAEGEAMFPMHGGDVHDFREHGEPQTAHDRTICLNLRMSGVTILDVNAAR
jgi:hypothetical protein